MIIRMAKLLLSIKMYDLLIYAQILMYFLSNFITRICRMININVNSISERINYTILQIKLFLCP